MVQVTKLTVRYVQFMVDIIIHLELEKYKMYAQKSHTVHTEVIAAIERSVIADVKRSVEEDLNESIRHQAQQFFPLFYLLCNSFCG